MLCCRNSAAPRRRLLHNPRATAGSARDALFDLTRDFARCCAFEQLSVRGPQPRELALGELPRCGNAPGSQGREISVALEKLPHLPVAHAAHRRHRGVERITRAQATDLIDQASIEHFAEARSDAAMKLGPIGRDKREGEVIVMAVNLACPLQLRYWTPRQLVDFECTLDTLCVCDLESGGGRWIEPRELRVQRRPTLRGGSRIEPGANFRIGGGQCREPLPQAFEIEHRAADEQGDATTRVDRRNRSERVGAEACSGIGLVGFYDIDQMVRYPAADFRVWLRSADVHATIDLRGFDG